MTTVQLARLVFVSRLYILQIIFHLILINNSQRQNRSQKQKSLTKRG